MMTELAQDVEVREDAEQEKKCHEVIELLLAAGYFRARIKVSEPFQPVSAWFQNHSNLSNVAIFTVGS
jgi:hypothetical protein